MIAETVSGSRYEIDVEGKCARRLSGPKPATSRMPDGVWREFCEMYPADGPQLNQRMLFVWADALVGLPAEYGAHPATQTSPVFLLSY